MTVAMLKPRCTLRIGVVGNRRFATEEMRQQAVTALGELWTEIIRSIPAVLDHLYDVRREQVLMRKLYSDEKPRLAVISSLAAGADQIGAQTAFDAAGARDSVAVQLEAVLPFAEKDYPGPPSEPRKEFRPEEARALLKLAGKACQVIRLAADYRDEESNRSGYAQARDLLLQNSDVLIAVYDPHRSPEKAGTIETVDLARKAGTPVVSVLLGEKEAKIQVGGHVSAVDAPEWRHGLEELVRDQLVIPEFLSTDVDDVIHHDKDENRARAIERLRHMSGDDLPSAFCTSVALAKVFAATWSGLHWLASAVSPRELRERLKDLKESSPPVEDTITLAPYAHFYDRASDLAIAFMRTYRGAFVLSYFLAGLAVAAAVAMMAAQILAREAGPEAHPPMAIMWSLCGMKIGILLLLLVLEHTGQKGKFQEAAADFRYLAELLRPMQWLSPIGIYPPAVELPLHAAPHDPRRSWPAWLARAVARSSPCVSESSSPPATINITAERAASALQRARNQWVQGQVLYHEKNSARMRALEEGLERIAKALLGIVLGAAVIACSLELTGRSGWPTVVLGAAAAILPAFIAGLTGITFQSEAKRLAMRSEAMAHALRAQQKQMDSIVRRIEETSLDEGKAVSEASTILKNVSRTTIGEASDWRVLYPVHEIHAG